MDAIISRADITAAHRIVAPYIRRTPIVVLNGADLECDCRSITLKLELLQVTGSFKARGAFANLLMQPVPAAGVVAASGGNHGVAVAYAARALGVPARIFVPTICSPAKVQRIRDYAAALCVAGDRYADALAASEAWAAESGARRLHAFDARETLLGQGTTGCELAAQVPDAETVLVPIGGGGLIGGIASWYAGAARVIGVEPVSAPTMTEALRAGRPVDAPAGGLAADSLAPRRVGDLVFPIVRKHVERVVLVEDDDIRRTQTRLWNAARVVAEPGGAAALAALICGAYTPRADEHVCVVISGGNTDAVRFEQ
jgi:threonine dehydratase